MSNYQGISRTYRPQTFSTVLGQEAIVTTLKNALRNKKTAQAYLFCGTRGTGKTTLARVLAKALNCPHLSIDSEPCNKCPSCLEISQGKNLNVLEIDGASNRGIDDIRQLNETVAYAPTSFGCKIFIIDEAHMLTKEAFNALLKTLEEPPSQVKFFLATTESHKIPSTIISRCQKFDLKRIPANTITYKLTEILKESSILYKEEALHSIASYADGSMRVAESLLDQIICFSEGSISEEKVSNCLGILPSEAFFSFDQAFSQENIRFAFEWAQEIFSSGKDLLYFFESFLDHYKNLLGSKLDLSLEQLPPSLQSKYKESSHLYTEDQLLYILDYLIQWHDKIHKSPCKRITLEMALLHILRSKYRVTAADLVLRLEELQNNPFPPHIASIEKPIEIKPILKEEKDFHPPSPDLEENKNPPTSFIEKAPEWELKIEPVKISSASIEKNEDKNLLPKEKLMPSKNFQIKYDTLSRFAAVELEGTLTKKD